MKPQLVVFFAGPTARDKPSADLLAALSAVTLLRTDERGTLQLVAEAERVRTKTGLPDPCAEHDNKSDFKSPGRGWVGT